MKNRDLQMRLDLQKWETSQKCNEDMSGKMPYCFSCQYQGADEQENYKLSYYCVVKHPARVENKYCATAYNRKYYRRQKDKLVKCDGE